MLMGRNNNLVNTVKPVYRQKLNLNIFESNVSLHNNGGQFQIQKP